MSVAKCFATRVYATWSPAANVSKCKEGSALKGFVGDFGAQPEKVNLTSLLAFLQFLKAPIADEYIQSKPSTAPRKLYLR